MRKLAFIVASLAATNLDLSLAWMMKHSMPTVGTHSTNLAASSAHFRKRSINLNNLSIHDVISIGKDSASGLQRRDFCYLFTFGSFSIFQSTKPAFAVLSEEGNTFRRVTDDFRYEFQPPSGFVGPGQKPLKTHLDEVNFQSSEIPGYQIGITVDPVRITSLAEFGTAEQVAAKVVLAEVNRDGVLEVKLLEDPLSGEIQIDGGSSTMFYQLNYLSSGKRGNKRNIAKFYVQNQKLFALTAQCKEENYEMVQGTMLAAVRSFRVF